jgi:hypothetical protein
LCLGMLGLCLGEVRAEMGKKGARRCEKLKWGKGESDLKKRSREAPESSALDRTRAMCIVCGVALCARAHVITNPCMRSSVQSCARSHVIEYENNNNIKQTTPKIYTNKNNIYTDKNNSKQINR